MARPLFRIAEFPEVFADACLRDSAGVLRFISLYGRDGSLMQFHAALQLGHKDGGVSRFELVDAGDGRRHRVEVGAVDRLAKFAGRLPRQNVFGPLSQVWVYDRALVQLDRPNRIGWALCRSSGDAGNAAGTDALLDKAWDLTRRLSPVALLDSWRPALQAWCLETRAYERLNDPLYPPLGPVDAMRVSITDHFVRFVGEQVKQGHFVL